MSSYIGVQRKRKITGRLWTGLNQKKLDYEVVNMCNFSQAIKRKAIAEGKMEGAEQKERENIIGLLENGLDVELISKALKVDKDKVQKLKEQLKH